MSSEQDTVFEVQGMTCPSCIRHVTSALNDVAGVSNVEVKLRDGLVVVTHDPSQATVTQMIEALGDAGYVSKQRQV
jgi:copper chaperone